MCSNDRIIVEGAFDTTQVVAKKSTWSEKRESELWEMGLLYWNQFFWVLSLFLF